jgi:hypothetical protein
VAGNNVEKRVKGPDSRFRRPGQSWEVFEHPVILQGVIIDDSRNLRGDASVAGLTNLLNEVSASQSARSPGQNGGSD